MATSFTLRNVTLGYRGKSVMEIPELQVPSGGMVCLIGPSGAGKSTLLEAIGLMSNTFLPSTRGRSELGVGDERFDPFALWAGPVKDLAQLRRERFSFIFQSTNLMPNFTIGENIRMAHQGSGGASFDRRVSELLEFMGLPSDVLDRATHELSGGQRQRIAFIRALAKDFMVLLADEPTGNLDHRNAKALFGLLRSEVARQNRTAVVVTHHVDLAEEFGDVILEIGPGTDTTPGEILPLRRRSLA